MRYLSVCSGIEAATVAWHPLGWTPVAFAEVGKFPSAVLAHHYPTVPNWGDLTRFHAWPDATIDLLVGGTPCQSFSVAGLRAGLGDPRGNLALTYLAVADKYRPRWLVWENVPGVLSSAGGRDFGAFLGGLAELGYGFAYRVLDAQYFGLAQRRARVFVVGHLGDWRRAAAVLFERESLSGHPAPRREAGEDVTGSTGDGLARCVTVGEASRQDWETCNLIAHSLRADGFDARQSDVIQYGDQTGPLDTDGHSIALAVDCYNGAVDGAITATLRAGNGNELDGIPAAITSNTCYNKGINHASPQETHAGALLRALREEVGTEAFTQWGLGILDSLLPQEVLRSTLHGLGVRLAAFSRRWLVYHALARPEAHSEGLVLAMREAERQGCASQGWRPPQQLARELGAYLSELSQPGPQATRFMRDLWIAAEGAGLLRQALSAVQEVGRSARGKAESTSPALSVRRLTAEECEFLQGFPRGYTAIPYRGKPAADGPRYKALGNSMAVPVMAWIGRRIQMVDDVIRELAEGVA